jgi:hypothetical protein
LGGSCFCDQDHRKNVGVEDMAPNQLHVYDFTNGPAAVRGKEVSERL